MSRAVRELLRGGILRIASTRGYAGEREHTVVSLDPLHDIHQIEYNDVIRQCPCVFVYILDKKCNTLVQLKMSLANKLANRMRQTWRVILICDHISAQSINLLQSKCSSMQVLSFMDVVLDRFGHDHVPKYSLLSQGSVEELEASIGNKTTWPRMIAVLDPIARLMWCEPGDCVKIIALSPVSGISVSFRCVFKQA